MRQLLVAIRDVKAEFFSPPALVRTKGEAIRSFSDAVNDPGHQFHGHAADFQMFVVAEFDILSGVVIAKGAPELVVSGFELVQTADVPLKAVR